MTIDHELGSGSELPAQENYFNENFPVVAVDISLGKRYDNVDFDYQQFDGEANRLGIADADKGELSILIKNRPPLLPGYAGDYKPVKSHIDVGVGRNVNKTLTYGMKQYADDKAGLRAGNIRYKVGQVGMVLLQLDVVVAAAAEANILPKGFDTYFLNGPSEQAAAFYGLLWFVGYRLHPTERRARQAAKQSQASIITLEQKTEGQYVMDGYN